ncbi:uncharacterized protein [Onthophagus taurus]|uniref:uncharacterized protein isoform X1 n=1 Tax=Onthophagus taurus TaxID=166361 RepID=UPI0039BE56E9
MLWHVSCCIWLMVILVISSDPSLTKGNENVDYLNKPKFRFNEVADFADVIESTEEEPKQIDRAKKNAEEEFVRNEREHEDDTSTLRLALEANKLLDLSLEGKEDLSVNTQHRRSIPRKYTNLLDLKYYYSKGLPIRGHLAGQNQKNGIRKRNDNLRKKRQLEGEANFKFIPENMDTNIKRNSINIVPLIAESNPYMSDLADATNDAYLKMRNYAATIMLLLTTPKSQVAPTEQKHIYEYHPANSITESNIKPGSNLINLKQRVKKCPDQAAPLSSFSQVPYTFSVVSSSVTNKISSGETKERKPTTMSPLAWEANLLKDANIKLKRQSQSDEDTEPLQPIAHTSENTSSHLEISNKILTPISPTAASAPCVLNKAKDPEEEGCEDNDDEDEDCSDQNVNGTCHLTSTGKPQDDRKGGRDVPNPPPQQQQQQEQQQEQLVESEQSGGDNEAGVAKCKQFWTVPAADIQRGVAEAVQNLVAPEKQLNEIKPYKTGTAHESDSPCVKGLIPKVQNVFDFPTMTMNLDSMVSKISKCMKSSGETAEQNAGPTTACVNKFGSKMGKSDLRKNNFIKHNIIKPIVIKPNLVKPNLIKSKVIKSTESSHHPSKSVPIKTKGIKRESLTKTEESTINLIPTRILENNYDDNVDTSDYPIAQLKRLQRDLFVVTQLEELLERLTGENKIRNFREDQNSQYDYEDDNDYDNVNNQVTINPGDSQRIKKRFLFKKKKRKKKKAKSVWKHIFGVRSNENRFLNQNFPNSQYAKYPI